MKQKYIKDNDGNIVLPITSVTAVRDNEGQTLAAKIEELELKSDGNNNLIKTEESRAKNAESSLHSSVVSTNNALNTERSERTTAEAQLRAELNAKQLEIGAVELDAVPTKDSTKMVNSGAVYTALQDMTYDVSVKHPDSGVDNSNTYTLSGALAVIPAANRKAGMSIKFIDSEKNEYVQYRFLGTTTDGFTNTDNWAIADEDVYVENPEYVYVKTDNENKILWAIKKDGDVFYGAGVPQQVKDYIEEKLAGFSSDEYEDIVAFLSDYLGSDTTLKVIIDKINASLEDKLDAEGLDHEALETVQAVENIEYISVETDPEGKILRGRKIDGTVVENCNVEYPNGIPSGIKDYVDGATGNSSPYPTLDGKTIVCFGDSITMFKGTTDGKNYPMWMDVLSDATVIGCGFGGTRLSSRTTPTLNPANISQAYTAFDLVNLVTSICNDDYSYLDAALQFIIAYDSEWLSSQYSETLNRVKQIDWSKVDYVTIFIGTNDWGSSANMGVSGSSDSSTVLGAINNVIKTLLLKYPHLKICWFTPLLRCIVPSFNTSTNYSIDDVCYYSTNQKYYKFITAHQGDWNNSDVVEISVYEARKPEFYSDIKTINGITLKEMAKNILDEVTLNHIYVYDSYNNFGWNRYNFSQYFLDIDATHPYKGFKYIAEKILKCLNNF